MTSLAPPAPRLRQWLRFGFLVLALALMVWAVVSRWGEVQAALTDLSLATVLVAGLLTVLALGVNALSWREVMRAVGFDAPLLGALRVFGISQVGKYVPGSVWPVLAQAEFAREHGVDRIRAMTGSIVAMIVGAVTSAVVGVLGMVAFAPATLTRYWWTLPLAALLITTLVPAVLNRLVALALTVLKRKGEAPTLHGAAIARAAGWSAAMWLLLGGHAWLLVRELVGAGASFGLLTGAFALAWLIGFVFVVAPAGVGAREGALVVLLASVATAPQALGLAIVSRFLMTVADGVGFGIGMLIRKPQSREISMTSSVGGTESP